MRRTLARHLIRRITPNPVVMWQDEQNNPREEDQGFHRTIYRVNGKLLNYAIKVWVGLMIGITLRKR
jgi:hypothetical protein